MRHSRVLTILSFAVLCSLSFPAVHAQATVNTPHKRNVLHRRAIHHLRATSDTPALTPSSTPSPAPSNTQSPSVGPTSTSPSSPVPSSTSSTPTSSSTDSSTSPAGSSSSSTPSDTTPTTSSTPENTSSTPSSKVPSSTTSSPLTSTSPTTSTTPAKSNSPGGVTTTPHVSNSPVNGGSSFSLSANPTSTVFAPPTGSTTSKGFFANKVAVGATFSIIGIIFGLGAVMGAITLIRRYRRARDDEDDFYEKYPGGPGSANHSRFSRELGQGQLGASATDLSIDAAPPEAYPDRAIHYGQPNPATVFRPVDYGIDYPPNADAGADPAAAAAGTVDPENTDMAYENYDYDPNRPRSGEATGHPFADPANATRSAPVPAVTYPRQVQGRAQEMVTVDSYYGPNSAGLGATGMGYAQ